MKTPEEIAYELSSDIGLRPRIAAAIRAERERCIQVILDYEKETPEFIGDEVIKRIREGK